MKNTNIKTTPWALVGASMTNERNVRRLYKELTSNPEIIDSQSIEERHGEYLNGEPWQEIIIYITYKFNFPQLDTRNEYVNLIIKFDKKTKEFVYKIAQTNVNAYLLKYQFVNKTDVKLSQYLPLLDLVRRVALRSARARNHYVQESLNLRAKKGWLVFKHSTVSSLRPLLPSTSSNDFIYNLFDALVGRNDRAIYKLNRIFPKITISDALIELYDQGLADCYSYTEQTSPLTRLLRDNRKVTINSAKFTGIMNNFLQKHGCVLTGFHISQERNRYEYLYLNPEKDYAVRLVGDTYNVYLEEVCPDYCTRRTVELKAQA